MLYYYTCNYREIIDISIAIRPFSFFFSVVTLTSSSGSRNYEKKNYDSNRMKIDGILSVHLELYARYLNGSQTSNGHFDNPVFSVLFYALFFLLPFAPSSPPTLLNCVIESHFFTFVWDFFADICHFEIFLFVTKKKKKK